jgi:hypothetical protein
MFIVLIHWRIKPTDACIGAFMDFWRRKVPINNDNELIGEFLSEPFRADDVKYPIEPVLHEETESYVSYVNVGLWKDEQSFLAEIGQYIPRDGSKKDFEQYPRRRIPLNPLYWRRGKFQLPEHNEL